MLARAVRSVHILFPALFTFGSPFSSGYCSAIIESARTNTYTLTRTNNNKTSPSQFAANNTTYSMLSISHLNLIASHTHTHTTETLYALQPSSIEQNTHLPVIPRKPVYMSVLLLQVCNFKALEFGENNRYLYMIFMFALFFNYFMHFTSILLHFLLLFYFSYLASIYDFATHRRRRFWNNTFIMSGLWNQWWRRQTQNLLPAFAHGTEQSSRI